MNFLDIPADIFTVRIKHTDATALPLQEQPVFSVEYCRSRVGEFEIRLRNSVVFVQPNTATDIHRLDSELASGRASLAQLANPAKDGSIELQIAFFTGECLEMGEIEIGVDEYVENMVAGLNRSKKNLIGGDLHKKLSQLCCFEQDGRNFFFLIAGHAIDGMLKSDAESEEAQSRGVEGLSAKSDLKESVDNPSDESKPDSDHLPQKPFPTRKNSFCVVGDGIRFVATETNNLNGTSIFTITRLTKQKKAADRALRLAAGKLSFVDWTRAGKIRTLAKAQMDALTKDDDSYLKKWDEFGELEGEMLLAQAREVGAMHYSVISENRDGTVSVRIDNASNSALNALASNQVSSVEIAEQLPIYLEKNLMSFNEFARGIEQEEDGKKLGKDMSEKQEENRRFDVAGFDAASKILILASESLPNKSGRLILSLAGDIPQIKRRMHARRAILEGRSANPQLGLLIEKESRITSPRTTKKIEPLTEFVRNKVFRQAPTVMQERAIDVALNTPDIAIVQGPPGTGKTTVIAAIIERLNEISNKRKVNIKGQVLLTGFQHDAVENMIGRLSLNGIPFVPKFGKRSGSEEDGFSMFERNLERWCKQLAAELREKNPHIDEIERETEIRNLCLQYIQAPTRLLAMLLVKQISTLGVAILGEDVMRLTTHIAGHHARDEQLNKQFDRLRNTVRSLRVQAEAFVDDGPERATDALEDLREFLEERELALLDTASLWRSEDGAPSFLDALTKLKKSLLVRLSSPPTFRVEKHNDEIIVLAEKAIKRIRDAGLSSKDRRSAALAEFLAELESNPYGMMDAVSDYSFAFAATCQQSVNKQMQKQKGISKVNSAEDFQTIEYDFVIVDEAARVSPRDLMIPMAQGKRIILVGDHRQLPHIVDEKVIERLSENRADELQAREAIYERDEENWSKISMFEYMFVDRLPILERLDGIKRRVTLDTQFRMHPLLGDFVSRNFYERFDKAEKFSSVRPASDFSHDLPGADGKAALWLDVPASKGTHKRSGTSWIRPAEASAIAMQLREWMNSEAGKDLSFGVISFYKAQAELIKKQLGKVTDDEQKLRIGTVDSFQGMEFDVVFLSMVRTMPEVKLIKSIRAKTEERGETWTEEAEANVSFGHLCLYNRLNVAMSRQQKLLVVAGDSGLLKSELSKKFIPGLGNFLELCRTEGRVLQCH